MFKIKLLILFILCLTLVNPALADTVVNGNFDTDLSGWTYTDMVCIVWQSPGRLWVFCNSPSVWQDIDLTGDTLDFWYDNNGGSDTFYVKIDGGLVYQEYSFGGSRQIDTSGYTGVHTVLFDGSGSFHLDNVHTDYTPPVTTNDTINDYTVIINSAQNTALLSTDTSFGYLNGGTTNDIDNSFNLTNSGNIACNVDAKFTTFNGSVYGFNATLNAGHISGTNFYMNNIDGATPAWVALTETTITSDMGAGQNVAADNVPDDWSVRLIIPAGQSTGDYTGIVQLTFSNV